MLKTFSNKGEANAIPLNAENLNFNFTELINILRPIGSYFETSDANFDPNTAWCGTWVLENDGTVLVSKSDTAESAFNAEASTIVGEEKHTLVVKEMPSHRHQVYGLSGSGNDTYALTNVSGKMGSFEPQNDLYLGMAQATGGNQPHNNVQPSKICFRWHRTA